MKFCALQFFSALAFAAPVAVVAALPTTPKVGLVGASNPQVYAKITGNNRLLQLGVDVFFDEMIQTDAKGSVQIIFLDRSSLTVGPNAVLKIDKFVYNPATSAGELTINATKGVFRFIGGDLSKKNAVSIKTPVSTLGIRGGIGEVSVADDGKTSGTFLYGDKMTVANEAGSQEINQPGFSSQVDSATSPPSLPVAVSPEQFSQQFTALSPEPGTNGGAKEVPTQESVGGAISELKTTSDGASAATGNAPPGTGGNPGGGAASQGAAAASAAPAAASADQPAVNAIAGDAGKDSTQNTEKVIKENIAVDGAKVDVSTLREQAQSNPEALRSDGGFNLGQKEAPVTPPANDTATGNTPLPPANTATSGAVINSGAGTAAANSGGGGSVPAPRVVDGSAIVKNFTASSASSGGTIISGDTHGSEDGDDFDITFTESGSGTNVFPLYLPVTGTPQAVTPANIRVHTLISEDVLGNGTAYSGLALLSQYGTMQYYQLREDISPRDELVAVQGVRLPLANLPVSGWQAFDFLPDLNRKLMQSELDQGYFEYNTATTLITSQVVTPAEQALLISDNLDGLLVYWGIRRFITADIGFFYLDPANHDHYFKLAFGNVYPDNTAANVALDGVILDFFGGMAGGSTLGQSAERGSFKVGQNIYGDTSHGVEGFVVNGSVTGTAQPLNQPVMSGQIPSDVLAALQLGRTDALLGHAVTPEHQGFMAGYINADYTGANGFIAYANSNPGKVYLVRDTSANTIGFNTELADMAGPSIIRAQFGSVAATPAVSAFFSDNTFAIQQASMAYDMNGDATFEVSAVDATKGAIVSGNIVDGVPDCTNCDYVEWGVWAADIDQNGTIRDFAQLIPFVTGEITQNIGSNASLPAAATYTGVAMAGMASAGGVSHHAGTMTANVDFTSRTLNSVALTFPDITNTTAFGYSGAQTISATGPAMFSGVALTGQINGTTITTGTLNGALFGPNAENIGGNFHAVTGTSGMAGVYAGAR